MLRSLTRCCDSSGARPHAQAPRHPSTAAPKEFVHPFIPSPQVVKPAVAPCRARDLHDLVAAIRQSEKNLAPTLKKQKEDGAPGRLPRRRRQPPMVRASSTSSRRRQQLRGASDSELDSQWNLVQSAVVALDGCVDCTRPRAARTTSCQRTKELLDAADKATPVNWSA